jgi:phosphoribosylformimino-5-aminoimidazole carboxamide ribotide isomerase
MTREVSRILAVIGSGGVASVEHLHALAEAGAEGAIIGTALYEGRLQLGDALAAAC